MGRLFRKGMNYDTAEMKQITQQIEFIKSRIRGAKARFSLTSNPDLIEAEIFELKSLQAKYRYLLKRAKELGVNDRKNQDDSGGKTA